MGYDDRSGEILEGRYRLLRKLAEGGMGAVYVAEHVDIGGKVAVKLLRSELAESAQFLKRFRREARANAALSHRNIVKVFDAGVAPWGEPYMVMEFLQGESLRALLDRSGPLPLKFAVDVARQALEGLAATHEAGIIHRDLKPDNLILVYEGGEQPTVKIIDFGISKFTPDRTPDFATTGIVLGTAKYMSPEQAAGREDVDHRTDLYSMGVVLYHMLTGAFPHLGADHRATLAHVLHQPPVPPAEHCAGFPDDVSRVIMKALARDPRDRHRGALELADALAGLDLAGGCMGRTVVPASESDLSPVSGELGDPDDTLPAKPGARKDQPGNEPRSPERPAEREWVPAKRAAQPRVRRIIAIVALLAVTGAGIAALYGSGALTGIFAGRAPATDARPAVPRTPPARVAPPVPTAPQVRAPEGVLVTVGGAPEGSKVFWDGVLVPMNPFRVERRETIVALRVEADGYQPFSIAVLPTDDQTVHVAMAPLKVASPHRTGSGHGTLLDRGAASAGGTRTMSEQKAVIAKNKGELKRCYDLALHRRDVPAETDLIVHFRLDVRSSGRVGGTELTGTGAAVPAFAECLEREVKTWVFAPSTGDAVVAFSFAFTTSG